MSENDAGESGSQPNDDAVLDLDAGGGGALPSGSKPAFDLLPYNPDPVRDRLRGQIALLLIAHVALIVLASLYLVWAKPWHWTVLKDYLTVVFAPLMTLLGTVIGYYFGVASAAAAERRRS